MWEDDWNKMIDEYEEMIDILCYFLYRQMQHIEQIKRKLEEKFQCNRNCSPDWEIFWKRLKK
jgi:hypothetical protein